jgi:hypothetical protein
MFKDLIKGFLSGMVIKLLDNYRHISIQLLRIEAAKWYLRSVQRARWAAIGMMWMGLIIAGIAVGVVLLHVGLFILLPWTVEAKAILGLVLGAVYVGSGVFALRAVLDERTWMEKSGARKMLYDAIDPSPKD